MYDTVKAKVQAKHSLQIFSIIAAQPAVLKENGMSASNSSVVKITLNHSKYIFYLCFSMCARMM